MPSLIDRTIERCKGSSTRTFILYPVVIVICELIIRRGRLQPDTIFISVMIWGYLQYRLTGLYRIRHGGGGPGMETPPDRLVTTGIFAYTRNPMYMGHVIFLTGLALTLHSWLAVVLAVVTAFFFQSRVLRDEERLIKRFGGPYVDYLNKVKRWLPGLF
jgi:protein-S-isoprenylcysteine O-methyltransferase Ste14